MEMEEQILAEGCREGEDTARRELYDRYAARLLAVCLRYSGDRAIAEDLMHDAFLKIYGAFDRFSYRGPGSLRAWMERIAVNVALEWLRNRNKLNFRTLDGGRALPDVPEPDPSEVARIPRDVLMEFVGELPDGYRTVFNLYCTAISRRCWGSTKKVPRRSCSGRGRCWPAGLQVIWRHIKL